MFAILRRPMRCKADCFTPPSTQITVQRGKIEATAKSREIVAIKCSLTDYWLFLKNELIFLFTIAFTYEYVLLFASRSGHQQVLACNQSALQFQLSQMDLLMSAIKVKHQYKVQTNKGCNSHDGTHFLLHIHDA